MGNAVLVIGSKIGVETRIFNGKMKQRSTESTLASEISTERGSPDLEELFL